MTAEAIIRWAVPGDAGHIVRLIRALAAYENEPASSVKVTEADILRDGFGLLDGDQGQPDRRFECLIAEHGGVPVGLCLFFHNYSTWEGRAGLYVEDLFVEPTLRGQGLGRDLMAAVARVALDRGCARVDLSVLDWNPTRAFYDRIEMIHMEAWRPYRMEQDAITTLARAAPKISGGD
ncbi:MAG: GNAT family N-acetyltransferase [Alphaproteobacteria bacterium]|jgi:GNAT superfamily N-acetyltransferase|nr:GNAT family N-acetyltransferase [Alphaproteobacteria bacterium]MDP6876046.1 GNAT family N-acetyltransferase [Alphaproteobacteria bacterium]